ncbi:hypothetical protein [Sagittula salina]|uniref:Uncharacterized protein n=1 Tax=Sagittula salina TaxID=2820268 RepID=A0A940MQ74_9RHOB|nr:hypothetical protein [Sagittula salina]MBP0483838.1 hypothetical protein [Sagittula salina]
MNSNTIHANVEQSAARAIACQHKLSNAIHSVRGALPLSLRFAIDASCKLSVEDLFTPHKLDTAQDVLDRLNTLIDDVGGVPVIYHSEEGHPTRLAALNWDAGLESCSITSTRCSATRGSSVIISRPWLFSNDVGGPPFGRSARTPVPGASGMAAVASL